MTILKNSVNRTEKLIKINIILISLIAVILIVGNILLLVFLSEKHSTLVITVNCVTDILFAWCAYFYCVNFLAVKMKLLSLCKKTNKRELSGKVIAISENTVRILGLDCRKVTVSDEEKISEIFVYAYGAVVLKTDKRYDLIIADNIVLEAENE